MFKPFFVHINPFKPGKRTGRGPRGATIWVAPHDNQKLCYVHVTWCSHKDEYNKKIGRSQAQAANSMVITKRELPQTVADIHETVEPRWGTHYPSEYMHLLRNFL